MAVKDEELIQNVVSQVVRKIVAGEVEQIRAEGARQATPSDMVPVNASNRHVHLSREHADHLFGPGFAFKKMKDLSQPGQFACDECVLVAGPKGALEKVRILGPTRPKTQIEILASDQFTLGVMAPVRQSGDVAGSAAATIVGPQGSVRIEEGVIIAQRHIHLDPASAGAMKLKDKEKVSVVVEGVRPVVFRDVLVRVHAEFARDMHIDIDEANACLIKNGTLCKVIHE